MTKLWCTAVALVGLSAFPQWSYSQSKSTDTKSTERSVPAPASSNTEKPKASSGTTGAKAGSPSKTEKAVESEPPVSGSAPSEGEAQMPQPSVGSDSEKAATGAYTVRLRDLEDRINRLKEQIFRSKARLSLLAETVLDRKIAGSKAVITFRNEMGGSFRLVKATFLLDGGSIFNKSDDSGSLAEREVISLFDGPVMPGEHTLSIVLQYRGHGYGIFSYLRGYQFKTKSSRTFTVNEGKSMKLEVVGYEKGGATTPLEERPDVRYIMNVADYEGESLTGDDKGKKE